MSRPFAGFVLLFIVLRIGSAQSNIPGPSPTSAIAQPQSNASPILRTNTDLVLVDVVVRDKKTGKLIDNLDRSSFQLLEDGRPQTVTVFEEHRATDAIQASPIPHLPLHVYASFPHYALQSAANVLLIDALNTRISDQSYARKQLVRYLDTLPTGTYIAVFLLGYELRMVKGFTTNLDSLIAALDGKEGSAKGAIVTSGSSDAATTEPNFDVGSSQSISGALLEANKETTGLSVLIRQDLTVSALKKLARFLGTVPGRKNLIWMSAGFPVPVGEEADSPQVREVTDLMTRARVAIYPVDSRGLMTFPSASHANDPLGGASVSLRGAGREVSQVTQSWASDHMTMQQIAYDTGGQAFYDTNAIGQSAVSAIAQGSNYYTLGYDPTNHKFNGSFRKIKVSVDDREYELFYRRGYDAVDPAEYDNAKIRPLSPMSAAMLHGGLPLSEIIFEARVLTSDDPLLSDQKPGPEPAGKPDKPLKKPITRYVIDYSIDPHHLTPTLLPDGRRRFELELAQSVFDDNGARVNQSDAGMEVDLTPLELTHAFQAGIHMRQEIDAPAGNAILRLGVRDASSDRIGTTEVPLRDSVSLKAQKSQ